MKFFQNYVQKRIPLASIYLALEDFQALYHTIWVDKPCNIIIWYEEPQYNHGYISLSLAPVGYAANPRTVDDLKLAVATGRQW